MQIDVFLWKFILLQMLLVLGLCLLVDSSPLTLDRQRRETDNVIEDSGNQVPVASDPSLPSYAIGRGPSFHPADVTISPITKYTANGKFSVFAPPHGDFFPFGGRFWFPKD